MAPAPTTSYPTHTVGPLVWEYLCGAPDSTCWTRRHRVPHEGWIVQVCGGTATCFACQYDTHFDMQDRGSYTFVIDKKGKWLS